ncbi:MAG: HlyD family secretion protein [Alphaproteobacteria bacterium]|nr:HlyD family secretion protein [Alphaproteobacteria bacterium]
MKSTASRLLLALVIIAVLVGAGAYIYIHRNEQSTDDAAIDGRTVTISPKIEGYVKNLGINDNQEVKAGDVLLEIDPADYITRRDAAAASLAAAQAALEAAQNSAATTDISAPSNLAGAQAQVDAAQANWQKAANDLQRMQSLSNEARSRQQLDEAVAAEKSAKSVLDDAQAKLRTAQTAPKTIAEAQANTDKLAAQVKQAQADLDQAELDLANTKIIAPMDGRITRRAVERGDYVKAAQSLGSLVGDDLWVIANFKETQLTHMRPGQKATITIDAYPGQKFTGKVDSVQSGTGAFFSAFPPENATGNFVKIVQRVPVKITFDKLPDPALALGPGMSVEPIVDTGSDGNNNNAAADQPDDNKE